MEQTLEFFLKNLRAQVDKFESDYRDGMRRQPSLFVAVRTDSDWLEQFTDLFG